MAKAKTRSKGRSKGKSKGGPKGGSKGGTRAAFGGGPEDMDVNQFAALLRDHMSLLQPAGKEVVRRGEFSYSTAVGLFKSVTGLVLVLLANRLAKKVGEEGVF